MVRLFLLIAFGNILLAHNTVAQHLYFTRDGRVEFYSSTPVEDIKAINDNVSSVLNIQTGEIEFGILIKAFKFEKKLMQEHFNEKYMESSKYPKALFVGKIHDIETIDFQKPGKHKVNASGMLTIHGVSREISTDGVMEISGNTISTKAQFIVYPEKYDIKIPSVVRENIAKEIEVTLDITLKPFKR